MLIITNIKIRREKNSFGVSNGNFQFEWIIKTIYIAIEIIE